LRLLLLLLAALPEFPNVLLELFGRRDDGSVDQSQHREHASNDGAQLHQEVREAHAVLGKLGPFKTKHMATA